MDALCILQDKEDSSDWDEQCKDVTTIYSNAYVTISAASSTSCTEGFLAQRGPRLRLPFSSARRKWATECFDLQFKWATRLNNSGHDFISASFDDRETCRWRHRGWTYQESESSTREFLFGNSRVYYRCRGMQTAMGAFQPIYHSPFRHSIRETGDSENLYNEWSNLLVGHCRYGRNSFTHATDVLPAISGFAAEYHKHLADEYHAGLWARDLHRALLWFTGSPWDLPERSAFLSGLRQLQTSYLPSWTPLGRHFPLVGNYHNYHPHLFNHIQSEVEALHAETILCHPGGNPFGAIRDGWLQVTCNVLQHMQSLLRREDLEVAWSTTDRMHLMYRNALLFELKLDFAFSQRFGFSIRDEECELILRNMGSFTWLLLGSCRQGQEWGQFSREEANTRTQDRKSLGLILYPSPVPDKFYRVGAFYPPSEGTQFGAGLRLFREMGERREVVII